MQPIVFEDRMKEVPGKSVRATHHYYRSDAAVLLDDGRALRHPYEVARMVQGVLGNTRKRLHDLAAHKPLHTHD